MCLCKHSFQSHIQIYYQKKYEIHSQRLVIFSMMYARTSSIHNTWNNLKGTSLRQSVNLR